MAIIRRAAAVTALAAAGILALSACAQSSTSVMTCASRVWSSGVEALFSSHTVRRVMAQS